MSRGFVKEDDHEEAPIIPKRAPLPKGIINYVTAYGLQQLKDELLELEDEQSQLNKENEREYRRGVAVITGKMNLLKERIASARVVKLIEQPKLEVRFGALVTLKISNLNKEQKFQIVGVDEANVKQNKIAFIAPIAKALMGARKGDSITFNLGDASRILTVLEINYPSSSD